MDHGYIGDVVRQTHNPRGVLWSFRQTNELGIWFVKTGSRDRRWQLWPWIQEVCGLLYCENEDTMFAVQCIPSPWTFNDNSPSASWEAIYGNPWSMGMSSLGLAEMEERSSEKGPHFEFQSWTSASKFHTDTDTDTDKPRISMHTLGNMSIRDCTTSYQRVHSNGKCWSTLPLR